MYIHGKPEDYKKIANQTDHHCFACSPTNPIGLKLSFYTDEQKVFSWLRIPMDMAGWNQIVHGGILATVLDETLAWTCIYLKKSMILTKGLNIEYLQPVQVNTELISVGWLEQEKGREVVAKTVLYHEQKPVCQARGVIKLFSPEKIQKLAIFDGDFIQKFKKEVLEQF